MYIYDHISQIFLESEVSEIKLYRQSKQTFLCSITVFERDIR